MITQMNKKILITILTILGLAVVAGGFYLWSQKKAELMQNNAERQIVKQNKQEVEREKNGKNGKNDGKNENNQNQENINTNIEIESIKKTPQLSPKEIEKLKKEKDLVWYEIPEMGIKFLVTKDAKEDLRYEIEKNKISVKFYWQSVIDFFGDSHLIYSDIFHIRKVIIKNNDNLKQTLDRNFCSNKNIVAKFKQNVYCLYTPQAFSFDKTKYNEYLKTIKDKHLKIYLNTIQLIQTK